MGLHTITLNLPDQLYRRLQQTAQSMRRPLNEVLIRAVEIGSPPTWDDVPSSYQVELAALDRLDDDSLWQIARARQTEAELSRYVALLERNAEQTISSAEQVELETLRESADLFMLKKAQAVALLHWRGHAIPPSERL
ncbi:conserved protein of unknown function [Candidatus Promineifilum breve]|uniref:Uncharacterized protein n=1 Tax=Candidatus Promineifilum breve TaxID=1806508 RepID=A0A160T438_9CHLR|nr:hypothetical protein [Candidatus Promineifilum breve]CUS04826.2 conserved protein of unknown function [Candidatus Promineifilum breve]